MMPQLTAREAEIFPRILTSLQEDLESDEPISTDYVPRSIDFVFDGEEDNHISIVDGKIEACSLFAQGYSPQALEIFFDWGLVFLVIGERVVVNRLQDFNVTEVSPDLTNVISSWIEE